MKILGYLIRFAIVVCLISLVIGIVLLCTSGDVSPFEVIHEFSELVKNGLNWLISTGKNCANAIGNWLAS